MRHSGVVCALGFLALAGTATAASTIYAATKQAFETFIDYYCDVARMQAITLKIFDSYGPEDPRRKLVKVLAEAALNGQTLEMSGGDQRIDLVHIDDIVDAFLKAAALVKESVPEISPVL